MFFYLYLHLAYMCCKYRHISSSTHSQLGGVMNHTFNFPLFYCLHLQVWDQRGTAHCNQCLLSTCWPWETRAEAVQAAVLQVASMSSRSSAERRGVNELFAASSTNWNQDHSFNRCFPLFTTNLQMKPLKFLPCKIKEWSMCCWCLFYMYLK